MTNNEHGQILQALASIQQQVENLQSDVRVSTASTRQQVEDIHRGLTSLRVELAGVISEERENKKKLATWGGSSKSPMGNLKLLPLRLRG